MGDYGVLGASLKDLRCTRTSSSSRRPSGDILVRWEAGAGAGAMFWVRSCCCRSPIGCHGHVHQHWDLYPGIAVVFIATYITDESSIGSVATAIFIESSFGYGSTVVAQISHCLLIEIESVCGGRIDGCSLPVACH